MAAFTTKRILADQTLFQLQGGWPDIAGAVQKQDIFKATEQWINSRFKLQQFNTTLASGETIPDNSSLATYSNITVTSGGGKNKSTATLPVMPISLPRGLGVYDISDGNGTHYIPIQKGQGALLTSDFLLNTLFDQVWYEQNGLNITFSLDLTLYGINTVEMVLMVFDMTQYSEDDILPLPADMQADLVGDLVKMFSPITPELGLVNNYPTPQTK
jgi:hypothetical protein